MRDTNVATPVTAVLLKIAPLTLQGPEK
jgi:hypothetical protein